MLYEYQCMGGGHIQFPTLHLQYVRMRFWQPNVWHTCCGYLLVSISHFVPGHEPANGEQFLPHTSMKRAQKLALTCSSCLFSMSGRSNQLLCKIATKFHWGRPFLWSMQLQASHSTQSVPSQRWRPAVICIDWLLQWNWRVPSVVVVVNLVTVLKVIVERFSVVKAHIFALTSTFPSDWSLCLPFLNRPQCTVRGHKLHHIIFLFPAVDLKLYSIHYPWKTIGCADVFDFKMDTNITRWFKVSWYTFIVINDCLWLAFWSSSTLKSNFKLVIFSFKFLMW